MTLLQAIDVTFNVKDFRCMVQLCEAMPANMVLRFEAPGAPLVVEPHLDFGALEVNREGAGEGGGSRRTELAFDLRAFLGSLRIGQRCMIPAPVIG